MTIKSTIEERRIETAHIEFWLEPKLDAEESRKAGVNVYRDEEWCKIIPAGAANKTEVVKPVDDLVKARFERQYTAWKENREAEVEGTDLRNWRMITPAQLKMCTSLKVFSVEQLAKANDATIRSLGPQAYALKRAAEDWLAAESGQSGKLVKEIEALTLERNEAQERLKDAQEENATLKIEIKALEKKIKSLEKGQ